MTQLIVFCCNSNCITARAARAEARERAARLVYYLLIDLCVYYHAYIYIYIYIYTLYIHICIYIYIYYVYIKYIHLLLCCVVGGGTRCEICRACRRSRGAHQASGSRALGAGLGAGDEVRRGNTPQE